MATSIDALAVGLSFAFLKITVIYPGIIIGIVAFSMTMVGMLFGERLGKLFGRRAEMLRGIVLIGYDAKILFEHIA